VYTVSHFGGEWNFQGKNNQVREVRMASTPPRAKRNLIKWAGTFDFVLELCQEPSNILRGTHVSENKMHAAATGERKAGSRLNEHHDNHDNALKGLKMSTVERRPGRRVHLAGA
jgi:hypothetical protein